METLQVPEKGHDRIALRCPICKSLFEVKVFSRQMARRRKFYFSSCFFVIAACVILVGISAGGQGSLLGFALSAPFILLAAWQLLNAIRGRFDASDMVSQTRGSIHRIYSIMRKD